MLFSQISTEQSNDSGHKRLACTSAISFSVAFMLVSSSALAQNTGLDAYNAYVTGLENLGLTIKNGSIDYDETNNTLTLSDSVLSLSGIIKDIPADESNDGTAKSADLSYSVSISSGTVTISGLTQDDNEFSAKSWAYSDDTNFHLTGKATGEGRFNMDGKLAGTAVSNYTFTMPELPAEDAEHQVSRWLPFVKATVLTSYDEAVINTTAVTFEAYSEDGDKETLVMSGTMQMDGYRVANAKDGQIGEYSVDEISQTFLTLDESSDRMLSQTTKQGKTAYENIDAAAMLDLFDPAVPASDEERMLIGYGSAVDYESKQDIGDGMIIGAKVDRSTIRDVTVIKRDNNVLDLLDQLLAQDTPSPEDLITSAFQLYRSFGIADARANGISISFPGPDTTANIDIKEMAMTDVNSDGIGEMMIVGLNAPNLPDGVSAKLDWAAISDISFADYPPMQTMIRTLLDDPDYGENNPLEVARAFLPRSFSYEVEGLDVSVPDAGRTQIAKAEFTVSSTVPPIPTNIYIKNDGVRVPVSSIQEPDTQALLKAMGLDEIVWSDETRFTWDEATKDLRLERVKLNIEGLGTAEASAHFANVPKELFEDPEGQGQVALIMAQFVDAQINFVDDGLTEKGLAHVAKEQNIPEAVFRDVLIEQAADATAQIQNAAFTEMVRGAVSDFLNNPGKISISMTPAKPVPLAQVLGSLAAPQTLPDLLNVFVTAN